jgi:GxxExxY protein
MEQALKNKGLKFKRQLYCKVEYEGKRVGFYYPDYVVEDKIVLELKVRPRFSKRDFEQVKKYLKTETLKLGILATFCSDGVKFSRVVNLY